MSKSLLFLPDISGYTQFVKSTEKAHGQQVIAELLEVLIEANNLDMKIAEVEGDAVFFYLEGELPSMERLLAQVEDMFTAFYSHLKLLDTNRICPCMACATAPGLQLKIIAHCADLEFIEIKGHRKPFGSEVIEAHRLLKNSVKSDNYVLVSQELAKGIMLPLDYSSKLFGFETGAAEYDGHEIPYAFSIIDKSELTLKVPNSPEQIFFGRKPDYSASFEFDFSAETLYEYIANYQYRHHWVSGVDEFSYDPNEVTRLGTEHMCIINHKHLNFIAVSKPVEEGDLVYGEMTEDTPVIDRFYTFYTLRPINHQRCQLRQEVYLEIDSWWKKILTPVLKYNIRRASSQAVNNLEKFVSSVAEAA